MPLQLAPILGRDAAKRLKDPFYQLLNDKESSVVIALLENAHKVLPFLKGDEELTLPSELFQMFSGIPARFASLKWRDQKKIFKVFGNIITFFDSVEQYEFATEILLPALMSRVRDVPFGLGLSHRHHRMFPGR